MSDGALLIDKATGITSNRALQEAKKLCGAGKAGHAGTLDPLASGLLVVLFGEATKLAGPLLEEDKEYLATLRLGERTSTGDAEGEVVERRDPEIDPRVLPSVLERFVGEIEQVPPMHSALKRNGVPLYKLARSGKSVERAPRRVRIHALEVVAYTAPELLLRVRCSKGTYVRTLAEDLGAALGTAAHLSGLRRTACGRFRVEEALTLEALAALAPAARPGRLIGLEQLVGAVPKAQLDREQATRFCHGQALKSFPGAGLCAVFGADGTLLGLGEALDGQLRPVRLVNVASG